MLKRHIIGSLLELFTGIAKLEKLVCSVAFARNFAKPIGLQDQGLAAKTYEAWVVVYAMGILLSAYKLCPEEIHRRMDGFGEIKVEGRYSFLFS